MNVKMKLNITSGIIILIAVVGIFIVVHVYYYSIVVPPLMIDRQCHIESSIQKQYASCTEDMNLFYDLMYDQLLLEPQEVISSEQSLQVKAW